MADEYTCVKIDFNSDTKMFYVKYYGACISTLYLFSRKLHEERYTSFQDARAAQIKVTAKDKLITESALAHQAFCGSITRPTTTT